MKRLLDEPTDEVTRLLIRAGANHQPPRMGKFRLLASLGLGGAIGLSTREVLAWLGTGGGKVALAVTVIGASAGGVYSLAGAPRAEPRHPAPSAPAFVVKAAIEDQPAPLAAAPLAVLARDAPHQAEQDPPPLPARRGAVRPRRTARAADSSPPVAPPSQALARRLLTEETLWVDQLRVAAEHGDRTSFERLRQGYAEQFPEGQLRPEVHRLGGSF